MVSTNLETYLSNWIIPQVRVKTKNIWNHHLEKHVSHNNCSHPLKVHNGHMFQIFTFGVMTARTATWKVHNCLICPILHRIMLINNTSSFHPHFFQLKLFLFFVATQGAANTMFFFFTRLICFLWYDFGGLNAFVMQLRFCYGGWLKHTHQWAAEKKNKQNKWDHGCKGYRLNAETYKQINTTCILTRSVNSLWNFALGAWQRRKQQHPGFQSDILGWYGWWFLLVWRCVSTVTVLPYVTIQYVEGIHIYSIYIHFIYTHCFFWLRHPEAPQLQCKLTKWLDSTSCISSSSPGLTVNKYKHTVQNNMQPAVSFMVGWDGFHRIRAESLAAMIVPSQLTVWYCSSAVCPRSTAYLEDCNSIGLNPLFLLYNCFFYWCCLIAVWLLLFLVVYWQLMDRTTDP